jgi:hypothetical protein
MRDDHRLSFIAMLRTFGRLSLVLLVLWTAPSTQAGAERAGAGDSTVHRLPVLIRTRERFRQLSVGPAGGTCGVLLDARLLCWGRNDGGQLGTADEASVLTPRVPILVARERFSSVSVGNAFACGLTTDARVLCWGSTGPAAGHGVTPMRSVVHLATPRDDQVVALSSGFKTSCLLTRLQHVFCVGDDDDDVAGRSPAAVTDADNGPATPDRS